MKRTIGTYKGEGKDNTTMVIVLAAMHGNELAGILALREVFRMLEAEKDVNPRFQFKGVLIGLVGNVTASVRKQRYIEQDLNRMWSPENVLHTLLKKRELCHAEELELKSLHKAILLAVKKHLPQKLVVLDLHTTSAEGGIFSIPTHDGESLRLGVSLKAPVVKGLLSKVGGTILHFIVGNHFQHLGFPKGATGIAFEAGQHDEPMSVQRNISAVINCLRAVGCLHPDDVDHKHDELLETFSRHLPPVLELKHVHHIKEGDNFVMNPGYINFQQIKQGEALATDIHGTIYANMDGLIMMPLYQRKGTDGFFLVQKVPS